MRLPYRKRRFYLSGVDWVIAAIDRYTSHTSPAGNHSTLIVELDSPVDVQKLQARLRRIVDALPILSSTISRDMLNLAPYWKVPSNDPLIPRIESCRCDSDEEFYSLREKVHNMPLPWVRAERVSFTIVSGSCGNHILMTFDHKLFDARGAETFLGLLACCNGTEIDGLLSAVKTAAAPMLKDWRLKFSAGRDVQRHMMELSGKKYLALSKFSLHSPPVDKGPNLKCRSTLFSEAQTRRISACSEKTAGMMMETVYLLAVCALAVKKVFSPRGDTDMMIPVPIGMRRSKCEFREMLSNKISFLFIGISISESMGLQELCGQIRDILYRNISEDFPEKFVKASRLARILPARALKKFMKLFAEGNVATFTFANVGSPPAAPENILGTSIINISHMPRIPTPPGLGIFFNNYSKQLQYSLVWDSNAVGDGVAMELCAAIDKTLDF